MNRTLALLALLLAPALTHAQGTGQGTGPAAGPGIGPYVGTWSLTIAGTPAQATLVVRADGTGTFAMPALDLYPRVARASAVRVAEGVLTAEVFAFSLEFGADLPIRVRVWPEGAGGFAGELEVEGDGTAYPLGVQRAEG